MWSPNPSWKIHGGNRVRCKPQNSFNLETKPTNKITGRSPLSTVARKVARLKVTGLLYLWLISGVNGSESSAVVWSSPARKWSRFSSKYCTLILNNWRNNTPSIFKDSSPIFPYNWSMTSCLNRWRVEFVRRTCFLFFCSLLLQSGMWDICMGSVAWGDWDLRNGRVSARLLFVSVHFRCGGRANRVAKPKLPQAYSAIISRTSLFAYEGFRSGNGV